MNRKQITRRILERMTRRKALNLSAVKREDPELVQAVYDLQPYWGWKAALHDAGIDYGDIRVEVLQSVECQLCGKKFQALATHLYTIHGITSEEYLDEYPDAELVSERLREQATGRLYIKPHPEFLPHWEPIYTREYVLDRLNEYAKRDFWMDHETIGTIDCSLIGAARSYVEPNWDACLRMINVDPTEYRGLMRESDFSLKELRRWLDDRERQGLGCTHGVLMAECDEWRRPPRIFVWALRKFSNWKAALQAAGVDLAKPVFGGHLFLTPEEVLAEIQRLKRLDSDLSHTGVQLLPHGGQLTSAGDRFFGSWTASLDAARIPKQRQQRRSNYKTASDVIVAIQSRISNQFGISPLHLNYGSRSDIPLWRKAFELFGNWRNAVAEAGGTHAQQREASQNPFSTKAKVIAELKRRNKLGQQLSVRENSHSETDKQLYVMVVGFLGSWREAVRAAGFDPNEYHEWNLNPPGKYKQEKEVIAAIRRRFRDKQPLNARGLTHGDHQDVPLLYTGRKLFGDWEQAVNAAGLDYSDVARKKQDYEAMKDRTYQTYTTRKEVTSEIQRRIQKQLPVTYRALAHGSHDIRDNPLLDAGKKLFSGDWDKALRAAGVDLKAIQPDWVRDRKKRNKAKSAE
jgi:hypothetical protein